MTPTPADLEWLEDDPPKSDPLLLHIVARRGEPEGKLPEVDTADARPENEGVPGPVLAEAYVYKEDTILTLRTKLSVAAGVTTVGSLMHAGKLLLDHLTVEATGLKMHDEVEMTVVSNLIVASAGADCDVRVWDAEAGQCLDALRAHADPVTCATFSPLGNFLASGSADCTARLWDIEDKALLATCQGHTDWVTSLAFSPDETALATSSMDCTGAIWDVPTGTRVLKLQGGICPLFSAAYSPSGLLVAMAGAPSAQGVQLWDARTGDVVRTLPAADAAKGNCHDDNVLSVCFGPDGESVLTGSQDCTAKLWDMGTGGCVRTLTGHTDGVVSASFFPDGRQILTGSADRRLKIFDAKTGECVRTLQGHVGSVSAAKVSPDGQTLVSGARDGTVRIWDSRSGRCRRMMDDHKSKVNAVCFLPY